MDAVNKIMLLIQSNNDFDQGTCRCIQYAEHETCEDDTTGKVRASNDAQCQLRCTGKS